MVLPSFVLFVAGDVEDGVWFYLFLLLPFADSELNLVARLRLLPMGPGRLLGIFLGFRRRFWGPAVLWLMFLEPATVWLLVAAPMSL